MMSTPPSSPGIECLQVLANRGDTRGHHDRRERLVVRLQCRLLLWMTLRRRVCFALGSVGSGAEIVMYTDGSGKSKARIPSQW